MEENEAIDLEEETDMEDSSKNHRGWDFTGLMTTRSDHLIIFSGVPLFS